MESWKGLSIIGWTISLVFLVLTFLHYRHSKTFGVLYKRWIMNYLATLIMTHIYWIILHVTAITLHTQVSQMKMFFIVHAIQGLFDMAYLLWTTVLCFSLWRKIKALQPSSDSTDGSNSTFIKCFIYVWSISIIFGIVNGITELYRSEYYSIYSTTRRTLIAIISIVIFSNFSMLLHATIIIIREKRDIRQLSGYDTFIINKQNYLRKKIKLYAKLYVLSIFLLFYNWIWQNLLIQLLSLKRPYIDLLFYGRMCVHVMSSYQGLFIYAMFKMNWKNE